MKTKVYTTEELKQKDSEDELRFREEALLVPHKRLRRWPKPNVTLKEFEALKVRANDTEKQKEMTPEEQQTFILGHFCGLFDATDLRNLREAVLKREIKKLRRLKLKACGAFRG